MAIDMNVKVPTDESLDAFIQMASGFGFKGIASTLPGREPIERTVENMVLFTRTDISKKGLRAVKKAVEGARPHSAIVAVSLAETSVANWAANDSRVDLLTLDDPLKGASLRRSTAKLAASSDTALEIPISPLLGLSGLARSKIIKVLRENAQTALDAGMPIVLSSGATEPIALRAPRALCHVGLLFGLDWNDCEKAVYENPNKIVSRNEKRFSSDYLGLGMEIVKRGGSP
ncbi:MAG: RNase P subunit p30 family protein [Candidatus Thorarchaeota archaeon]